MGMLMTLRNAGDDPLLQYSMTLTLDSCKAPAAG
jgi:hypothetical protein